MADWKKLESHALILLMIIIILSAFLLLTPPHVFRPKEILPFIYEQDFEVSIHSPSGLYIRVRTMAGAISLVHMPPNGWIEIIQRNVKADSIDGQHGYWYKVRYQEHIGYAWGNYIDGK